MNKIFKKLNQQKIVVKLLLVSISILFIFQIFSFYFNVKEGDKFIPIDIKVVSTRFETGYMDRYFYDSYVDVYFDRDLTTKDLELFGVKIEGEKVTFSKADNKVLRVTFSSEFLPKKDRVLKLSYAGNVFFEKSYRNEGLTEKEATDNLPRSLIVE